MKKIMLALAFVMVMALPRMALATGQPIIYGDTVSAFSAVSITDSATTHLYSRAVWIGTTQSIDLYVVSTGAWVTFQGATAGTIIPVQASGARITSGPASPNAGDIVFLS
jgi:hypothetical protein